MSKFMVAGFVQMETIVKVEGLPVPYKQFETGKIGGGDVKLMAASGFALGVSGGFWMMFWGLLMALLWNASMRQGKSSLPLAPFLAFGCFVVLLPVS